MTSSVRATDVCVTVYTRGEFVIKETIVKQKVWREGERDYFFFVYVYGCSSNTPESIIHCMRGLFESTGSVNSVNTRQVNKRLLRRNVEVTFGENFLLSINLNLIFLEDVEMCGMF